MIPLTVIVGIGGQGSAIAKGVHERLLDFADQHPDVKNERLLVDRSVRLFAIDTVRHVDIETGFSAGNYRILNPADPDAWIIQRNGFDREWWPAHIDQVGAFDRGAGMMRAKGRLAYRMQGHGLAARIVEYVTELRGVRGDADSGLGTIQPAYVYIIGSLSGGTGSGILLTLAMHLRQLLDPNTKIIGAIPLASIMELGPASDYKQTIWANCSAGLREIEWWLLPPNLRPQQIYPFFQVGTEVIGGDSRDGKAGTPFNFCYLFTRRNRAGQSLDDFNAYTQLIADCIALDLYSPISGASQQSFSNDLLSLLPTTRPPDSDNPKPIIFGGASAAALVYPTNAIANYLGGQLMAKVLDSKLLKPVDPETQPKDWLVERQLENRGAGQHRLRTALKRDIVDPTTQGRRVFPARPHLKDFADASKDEVQGIIERGTRAFDENAQPGSDIWIHEVNQHVSDNRRRLVHEHRSAIRTEIMTMLSASAGHGFQQALAFARIVRDILKRNAEAEDFEINNPDNGLQQQRATYEEDLWPQDSRRETPSAIERLRKDWSINPFTKGGKAKEDFLESWWWRYVACREQLILARAAKSIFEELILWLDGIITILNVIETDLKDARTRMTATIKAQLGARRPGQLVFEESVLAEPEMIEHVFGALFKERADPDSPVVTTLATTITGSIRTLLEELDSTSTRNIWVTTPEARNRAIHEKMGAVREEAHQIARARFEGNVSQLTLWQAMELEFHFRVQHQRYDDHLGQLGLSRSNTPTGRDLDMLCDRYILRRVKQCVDSALPFWDLDNARKGRFEAQFPVRRSGIVAFDDAPFQQSDGGSLHSMRQQIGDICRSAGFSIETRDQSRHRLYATSRELGAPLFMLSDSERRGLATGEQGYTSARGSAYIDERFKVRLPVSIELGEGKGLPAGHREIFDLGLAFGMGYLRPKNGSLDEPIVATRNLSSPTWQDYATDITAALERTLNDETPRKRMRELVEREWGGMSPGAQRQLLELCQAWLEKELEASSERDGFEESSATTETLERMLNAFRASMDVLV